MSNNEIRPDLVALTQAAENKMLDEAITKMLSHPDVIKKFKAVIKETLDENGTTSITLTIAELNERLDHVVEGMATQLPVYRAARTGRHEGN
jgi:hypothetical protein